jgi:hypothetical protein
MNKKIEEVDKLDEIIQQKEQEFKENQFKGQKLLDSFKLKIEKKEEEKEIISKIKFLAKFHLSAQ